MTAHDLRRADDRFMSAWDMPLWAVWLFVLGTIVLVGVIGAALGKSLADYSDRLERKVCEREAVAMGTDPAKCYAQGETK